MPLADDVNAAIAAAMKARDRVRLDALRMLKTALTNRQIERGRPLDETEARQVVASLIKQRRESIEIFTKAGRMELAGKEAHEIGVLETYLPPAMDADELEAVVRDVIAESGAASPKDMGRVMKAVMARLAGRGVDGKAVSELVRRTLGG